MKKYWVLAVVLSLALATFAWADSKGTVRTTATVTGTVTIGTALPAGTNNIGDVDVLTIAAGDNNIGNVDIVTIAAGETHIGAFGGSTTIVSVTPTVTAGAYSANDIVGGEMTISSACRAATTEVILQSVSVSDLAMQNVALQIFFFQSNPAGTYTDNAELDVTDADLQACLGVVEIAASDWINAKDNSFVTKANLGIPMVPTSGSDLWAICKTTGTPTYAGTTDLEFHFGFLRD